MGLSCWRALAPRVVCRIWRRPESELRIWILALVSFHLSSATSLIAPVAVAFLHNGVRLAAPICGERLAHVHLLLREMSLPVAADVPLVALMWFDEVAWHCMLLTCLVRA